MEETERSLHDAIMIVRRAIKNDAVVAGGGAIEMELSKYLRDHSRSIAGKEQLIFAAMAKAFEVIPRQLCDNAGFDATNILNKLRQKHAQVLCQIFLWAKISLGLVLVSGESKKLTLQFRPLKREPHFYLFIFDNFFFNLFFSIKKIKLICYK